MYLPQAKVTFYKNTETKKAWSSLARLGQGNHQLVKL